jgi:hypothetical protein
LFTRHDPIEACIYKIKEILKKDLVSKEDISAEPEDSDSFLIVDPTKLDTLLSDKVGKCTTGDIEDEDDKVAYLSDV